MGVEFIREIRDYVFICEVPFCEFWAVIFMKGQFWNEEVANENEEEN